MNVDTETLFLTLGLIGGAFLVLAFIGWRFGPLAAVKPMFYLMLVASALCFLTSLWIKFDLPLAWNQLLLLTLALGAIALRNRVWHASGSKFKKRP